MAYEKDQKILTEVSEAVDGIKREAGLSSNTSIRADLLNEDPKSFSTDSMSYVGIAAGIMEENEELFALSRLCDRFAPQYLKICRTLEKTVEYLGSVCVTKSALKCYQEDVAAIEQLTIHRLHQMISFNFRKVKAALDQKKEKLHEFDLELYDQMMSFAKVMERLCVTETRAVFIDLGFEKPMKHVKKTVTFSEKESDSVSPFHERPSYPINYDVLEKAGARSKEQGAIGQDSGSEDQVPVNSGDNMQAAETGLDDATESRSDSCEGSETELLENIEPSRQESTPSVSSEEENSGETAIPAEDDFDERFAQLPDAVKACVVSIIDNPDNLKNYLMCLADENYCRIYREKTDIFREAIAFINSAMPQQAVDSG